MQDLDNDPEQPTATAEPRVPGRGLRWALAASVGLNLLVLGTLGGALLSGGPSRGDGPGLRAFGLGPFALAMTREDRSELRARIDGEARLADRRALGGSFAELQQILTREPFDRAAAGAALARARAASESLLTAGHHALLTQLEAMGPEARAALAERLDEGLRRRGGRAPAHRSDGHSRDGD